MQKGRNEQETQRLKIKKNGLKNTKKNRGHYVLRLAAENFRSPRAKFITLTFAENLQDLDVANKLFKQFIQRLRRYSKKDFKYIAAIEFQKRGAIHYHMIADLEYIDDEILSKQLWQNGHASIFQVNDSKHAASYCGKYMLKGSVDPRLAGRKSYFTSRNLAKPSEFINKKALACAEAMENMEKKVFCSYSYNSEYNGEIQYTKFFLKDDKQFTAPKVDVKPLVYNSDLYRERDTVLKTNAPVAKKVPVAAVAVEVPSYVQGILDLDFSSGVVLSTQDAERQSQKNHEEMLALIEVALSQTSTHGSPIQG